MIAIFLYKTYVPGTFPIAPLSVFYKLIGATRKQGLIHAS